jgi:hypothetical protein
MSPYLRQWSTGKFVPVLRLVRHHENAWGSGDAAPRILNIGGRWMWVVILTLRLLYPRVPNLQEAGWSPEPVWKRRKNKLNLPLPGLEPQLYDLLPPHGWVCSVICCVCAWQHGHNFVSTERLPCSGFPEAACRINTAETYRPQPEGHDAEVPHLSVEE